MNFDRNTLTAITFGLVFYVGYEYYLNQKYPERYKVHSKISTQVTATKSLPEKQANHTSIRSATNLAEQTQQDTPPLERIADSQLVVENDVARYKFNQDTGSLEQVWLKEHTSNDYTTEYKVFDESVSIRGHAQYKQRTLPRKDFAISSHKPDKYTFVFTHYEDVWKITETWKIAPQGYGAKIHVEWENHSAQTQNLTSYVDFAEVTHFATSAGWGPFSMLSSPSLSPEMITYSQSESGNRIDLRKYCESDSNLERITVRSDMVDYLGTDSTYFLKAIAPELRKVNYYVDAFPIQKDSAGKLTKCSLHQWTSLSHGEVGPGKNIRISYNTWFGPKDNDAMQAFLPALTESLDLGVFSFIAKIFFTLLREVYKFLGNWGFSIILLTVFIKLVLFPAQRFPHEMGQKMKMLTPELNRLKEKYGKDPQRLGVEQMALYKKYNVNPALGCLTPVLQIPLFIAFFSILRTSVDLRHAPFILWIEDLSAPDPYYVLPILYGLVQHLQQKTMPTNGMNKEMESIMKKMPLFFSLMMFFFPAGVVLYSTTNAIMMVFQQYWLQRNSSNLDSHSGNTLRVNASKG
ncbi:MAG: membrane protein insertase YidC [Zetaproteobacteria bacterium]|nr:membrane protein insertase YidC [Zetaproteobacteria bacterium]